MRRWDSWSACELLIGPETAVHVPGQPADSLETRFNFSTPSSLVMPYHQQGCYSSNFLGGFHKCLKFTESQAPQGLLQGQLAIICLKESERNKCHRWGTPAFSRWMAQHSQGTRGAAARTRASAREARTAPAEVRQMNQHWELSWRSCSCDYRRDKDKTRGYNSDIFDPFVYICTLDTQLSWLSLTAYFPTTYKLALKFESGPCYNFQLCSFIICWQRAAD